MPGRNIRPTANGRIGFRLLDQHLLDIDVGEAFALRRRWVNKTTLQPRNWRGRLLRRLLHRLLKQLDVAISDAAMVPNKTVRLPALLDAAVIPLRSWSAPGIVVTLEVGLRLQISLYFDRAPFQRIGSYSITEAGNLLEDWGMSDAGAALDAAVCTGQMIEIATA